jgi:3-keto-disaccharide hydrolase
MRPNPKANAALHLPCALLLALPALAAPARPVASPVAATKVDQTKANTSAKPDKRIPRSYGFYEPEPIDFGDHDGYQQIFDGKDLNGWDGDPAIWHVEDGAIVGLSTKEKPVGNTYIIYRGLEAHDFDLKLEIKVEQGGGSGIQYRSKTGLPWRHPLRPGIDAPKLDWMMTGPQADFWFPVNGPAAEWTGQLYIENSPLGIQAWRGQVVESSPGDYPKLMAVIGDRDALGGYVKVNDWNQYVILARGGTFIHILNGHLMAVYIDDDPNSINNQTGQIGIELESSPSKVSVRDVWIKKLN